MESSVFMLKPIVDKFYEEAKIYKERIKELEKKVKELEVENAKLVMQSRKKKVGAVTTEAWGDNIYELTIGDSDDDVYAAEALAPPASSLAQVKEEKTAEIAENSTTTQEENKQVKVETEKSRKEYMKEYQRSYRKKQKDIALNN
jgi:hypothetical protein